MRAAEVTAEIALSSEEIVMEEILREPVELTESELREVAGGGGPHCGCDSDGSLINIEDIKVVVVL
jgi:hypothetical protein